MKAPNQNLPTIFTDSTSVIMKLKFTAILILLMGLSGSLYAQEDYVIILDKDGTIQFNYLKENIGKLIGTTNASEITEMQNYLTQDWQFNRLSSTTVKSSLITAREDKAELLYFTPDELILVERPDLQASYIGIGNAESNTEIDGQEVMEIAVGEDAKAYGFTHFEGFSIQLATAQASGPSKVKVELMENEVVLYAVEVDIKTASESSLNYFENTLKLRNLQFESIRMTAIEGSFYLGTGLESLNTRFYLIKE
jgi:hypothetical protein